MVNRWPRVLMTLCGVGLVWAILASGLNHTSANLLGQWNLTGHLNVARTHLSTATRLANGQILIAGGQADQDGVGQGVSNATPSAELFDPEIETFLVTGDMFSARTGHAATLLPDGRVLITGGITQGSPFSYESSAELYDPGSGVFTPTTGSMNSARSGHTATLLPSGSVLIAGGNNGANSLNSAELYDPVTETFTVTGSMGTSRANFSAVLLDTGFVLIVGGRGGFSESLLTSAELYDSATGNFMPTGDVSIPREDINNSVLLLNGQVLIVGGAGSNGDGVSSGELYDPSTGTFALTGELATSRRLHRTTRMPNGQVVVSGGWTTVDGFALDSVEIYDPTTGTFTPTGSLTTGRGFHTATVLENGQVLVTGGSSEPTFSSNAVSSSEIFSCLACVIPIDPPSNLLLTDVLGDEGGALQLVWDLSSSAGIAEQRIFSSANQAGPYSLLATVNDDVTNSYIDSGLTNGVTHYYVLRTFDGFQESGDSNEASGVAEDNLAPAAPLGLVAIDVPDDPGGFLSLSWIVSTSSDVIEQRIYQATTEGGPYNLFVTIPESTTNTYEMSGLTDGTTYYHVVRSFDGTQESVNSNEASAVPLYNKPVADSQDVTTLEDTSLPITLTGRGQLGDPLTFIITSFPSNGVLVGTPPDLSYQPNLDSNGLDSFAFVVQDTVLISEPSIVSIIVSPVDDHPVFNPIPPLTMLEDSGVQTITITGVAPGPPTATDEAGQSTILFANISNYNLFTNFGISGTGPTRTFTLQTVPDANGIATITVTAINTIVSPPDDDGVANILFSSTEFSQTFTVEILPVNDPPTVASSNLTWVPANNPNITEQQLYRSSNPGGPYTLASRINNNVTNYFSDTQVKEDTTYYYVLRSFASYLGSEESNEASGIARRQFSVRVLEDSPVSLPTLMGNDVDGDLLTLEVAGGPANGLLSGTAPNFTYTPTTGFTGMDSFVYTANDGISTSEPATVFLDVIPLNDFVNIPPVALHQNLTGTEDTVTSITLTGSDGNPEVMQALTFTLMTLPGEGTLMETEGGLDIMPADLPKVLADSNLFYKSPPVVTSAQGFEFFVQDDGGTANGGNDTSSNATVIVELSPVNDPPRFDTIPDQTVNEDVETQSITITGVGPGPEAATDELGQVVTLTAISNNLALIPNPTIIGTGESRTLIYTPVANAFGTATITLTADDGEAENSTTSKTVEFHVLPMNDPPTATDDFLTIRSEAGTTNLAVLPNDIIAPDEGETLTIIDVGIPDQGGTVTVASDGLSLEYTPSITIGVETFSYTMNDGTPGSNSTATVQATVTYHNGRASEDLFVLYNFEEGAGTTVGDTSGLGAPLEMTITDPSAVTWVPGGGLHLQLPTVVNSQSPATKILDAVSLTNEVTLEAWVHPDNVTQDGPARVVTIGQDPNSQANLMLGQGRFGSHPSDVIDVRLNTSNSSTFASINTSAGTVMPDLLHMVFTRDTSGNAAIYLDGQLVQTGTFSGDFSSWSDGLPLAFGNLPTGERPWLGTLYLVAFYDQALDAAEVNQNFLAGPDATSSSKPVVVPPPDITISAPDPSGLPSTAPILLSFLNGFMAFDHIEGDLTALVTHDAPGQFPLGKTTVTFSVTDSDNNTRTAQSTVTITSNARITTGLQALYNFEEGEGTTIGDVSEMGSPLEITIADPSAVDWVPGSGLHVHSPTVLSSQNAATTIIDAARLSNAITMEAWIKPDNVTQDGPARVVTIGQDSASQPNIMLGEGRWGSQASDVFDVRLHTTNSGFQESMTTPAGTVTPTLMHVVFTRDTAGNAAIYLDGELVHTGTFSGDFSSWNNAQMLAFGNEPTGGRPWLGTFYLVAFYDRALDSKEVSQNFMVGPDAANISEPEVIPPADITISTFDATGVPSMDPTLLSFLSGATAFDSVDGDLTPFIIDDAPMQFPLGITIITFSVTDSDNHIGTAQSSVTVVDTTAPLLSVMGGNPQVIEGGENYIELTATASDLVDGDISGNILIDASAVNTGVVGSYTVRYDVSDAAGNAAEGTRTVTVVDTTAPVLTVVGDNPQVIEGGESYIELTATASDQVDGDISGNILIDASAVNTGVVGSYTVRYNVSDAVGNAAVEGTRTVTVEDTRAPVLTIEGANPQVLEMGSQYTEFGATANDVVDGDISENIVIDASAVNTGVLGSYTVSYNVDDVAGNPALTVTRAVTVADSTMPELMIVGANPQVLEVGSAYTELGATANDLVDGDLSGNIVIDTTNVNLGTLGNYVVTYDVSDSSGNAAVQGTRTVHVVDTTVAVLMVVGPNPQTLEVGSTYIELGATANDSHEGDVSGAIVIDASAVNPNTLGSYAVTYDVSDSSGNAAPQETRIVTVADTTVPVLTVVGANPQLLEVGSAYVELGATANDNHEGDVSVGTVIDATAVDTSQLGSYVVTYDVNDGSGNSAVQGTRTVTVVDTTVPVLTVVGVNPQVLEVGSPYSELGATASDGYDGDVSGGIVIDATAVDTETLGSYVVIYDVSDDSGNAAVQGTRTVTVVDTTMPVLAVIGSNPQVVEVGSGYVELGATASDTHEGDISGDIVIDASAVNLNSLGSYVVTYDVSDGSGNAAVQGARTVTVVDTTPPVLTVVGANPQVVEGGGGYVELGATASDTHEGDISGSIVIDATNVDANTLDSYVVTYDVSDGSGNAAVQGARTVTVVDTTPPVLTVVGANPHVLEVGSTYTELGAMANDSHEGDVSGVIVIDATNVNTGMLGSYVVTYDVSDSRGNAAVQGTRTVNVVDTIVPVLTVVGANPQVLEVGSPYVELGATANDSHEGDVSGAIVSDTANLNLGTLGSYVVTYDVSDSSGNAAVQGTRTINVVDTTGPVLTVLGADPQVLEVGSAYVELGATATDNGEGDVSGAIVSDTTNVNLGTLGSYVVTYNVSDNSGNAAVQGTRTVTVVDTTAPVLMVVGVNPQVLEVGSAYVELGATATDNGEGDVSGAIVSDATNVNLGTLGSYVVTYDVSDSRGNVAVQGTRTVNVVDTTVPVLTVVGVNPQVLEVGSAYVELGATASDSHEGDVSGAIVSDTTNVNLGTLGSYVVTYDVSDSSGNAAVQGTRTINVVDTIAPVLTVVGANPQVLEVGSPYVELGATANDSHEGDVSSGIVVNVTAVNFGTLGSYVVTYNVSDSSGNAAAQGIRTVNVVDTTAPVLTIVGPNPQVLEIGSAYVELGATANDSHEGDVSGVIVINASAVDPETLGDYVVTYDVSDNSGNTSVQETRTVTVVSSGLQGLLGHWEFEEGTGPDTTDSSGNSQTGTVQGATWDFTCQVGTSCLRFDGVNDGVTIPSNPDVVAGQAGDDGLTLAAWINPDDFGVSDARIISKATGTAEQDHYWMLSTINSGGSKLRFRLKTDSGGTKTLIANSGILTPGVWTHVAATYDGITMRLYKDGQEVGSTAKSGTIVTNAGVGVSIGQNPLGTQPFDGLMDDVRIYDHALSTTELQELMIPPAPAQGFVGHWNFEEGTGPDAADNSGNSHTGTIQGATWDSTCQVGNSCLRFDGVNDGVTIPSNPDVVAGQAGDDGLTLAAWINPDDFGVSDARIISKATGTAEQDNYWMLSTINSGGSKLRFRLKTDSGGTKTLIASSGILTPGVWTHVAATYDGITMRLYKDGQEVGSTAKSGTIVTNAGVGVSIGQNPLGTQPFDGLMDDVRIYDHALSTTELQELSNPVN